MARDLKVRIIGDAASLHKAYGRASTSSSSFGRSLQGLSRNAKIAAVALGAAGAAGLGYALKKGIEEFSEASKVSAQTAAVLKSTGGVAKVTAKEVDGLAASLMKKSGIDDEAIKSGENMLLTFTKIRNEAGKGNDIFNQATKATLDLSVAMGKDMADSAILVGKALNDPLKGMTALGRAGIQFTADQKKTIEAMVKTGDVMGAQKLILAELNTQFGGSAKALGDTLPGKINILKQSLSNIAGQLVSELAPAFERAVSAASDFVTKLSEAKGVRAKIEVVLEGAETLAGKALKVGQDVGKQIMTALGNVDWQATGNTIAKSIGDAFRKSIPVLAKFGSTISEAFQKAIQEADWVTIGAAIGKGIKDGTKKAAKKQVEEGLIDTIKQIEPPAITAARAVGADIGDRLAEALGRKNKERIPQELSTVPGMIRAGVDPAIAVARSSGGRIGFGLSGGLTAALSGVGASVASTIIAQINMTELQLKQKYGIHSPSTRWRDELGVPLGQGVVVGLVMGLAPLPEKMKESMRNAIEAARQAVATSRGRLGDVWGGVTSDALAAFDAIHSGILTKSEKLLAALQSQRAAADRAGAVTEARAGLATALAGTDGVVDPAAVKSAQKALDDALFAQREYALQQRIIQERRELDARTALQRRHFEQALQRQLDALSKQGAGVGAATKAITKLLNKYDVDFESAGDALGRAFVTGLKEAILKAAKGAGSLGKVIENAANGINVPGRAAGGPVTAGRAYMVGERGPELFVPGRSGGIYANGSGGGVYVTVNGWVGNDQQIAKRVRDELTKLGNRGDALGFA